MNEGHFDGRYRRVEQMLKGARFRQQAASIRCAMMIEGRGYGEVDSTGSGGRTPNVSTAIA